MCATFESNFTAKKVEHLYKALNITNKKVKIKTEEYVRLLDVRAPYGVNGGDTCKYAVCLQIASRMYNCSFNRTEALKICGVDSDTYRHTYGLVVNLLEIRPQITLESVGILLGIPHITPLATKILEKYKERVLKTVPDIQKPKIKLDSSPFVSVPFALAAEYRALKIDKNTLLDVTETTRKDFSKLYDSMDELVLKPIKNELQKLQAKKMKKSSNSTQSTTQNEKIQDNETDKNQNSKNLSEKIENTEETENTEVEVLHKKNEPKSPQNETNTLQSQNEPKNSQNCTSTQPNERLLQIAVDILDFSKK